MRRSATVLGFTLVSLSALLFLGCGGSGGYGGSSTSGNTGSNIATSITISPASATITMGAMQQYMAVAKNSSGITLSGVTLTWASSNTAVATINNSGAASAVGIGSTSITASVTYNNSGIYTTGAGTTYTSNMATLTVSTMDAVMGTAATGHALAGALITLKDAEGKTESTLSGDDGRFSLSIAGLKAPFLMKADDGRGRSLFGAAAGAGGANLDTVTDLMVRAWYMAQGNTPEAAFADMSAHPAPDAKSLQALDRSFRGVLRDDLTAEGLDPDKFSLFSSSFNADSTGFDAVLDNTHAVIGGKLVLQDDLMDRSTDASSLGR